MTDANNAPAAGKPGLAISPLAVPLPAMGEVQGVRLAVGRAGFYKHERDDLLLMAFDAGTTAAGVFTKHNVGSAPVDWCKEVLAETGGADVRGLIVNAGCANSFTGEPGALAAERTAQGVADQLGATAQQVVCASTGVIGVVLDDGKITPQLPGLAASLRPDAWETAAEAIMTTDTFPKGAVANCEIDGLPVKLAGICKGSGMIAPNMATMLAFAATDAAIAPQVLQALVRDVTIRTFNAVTVDGDRSTNDTFLLFATGKAGNAPITDAADPRLAGFKAALEAVALDLAQQLVRDGEGATRFVKVEITGAVSEASAFRIARTVCESPLVKTAIAGGDANWGRIVMAVGRADEPIVREKVSIRFGALWAAKDGKIADSYDEAAMTRYMQGRELEIAVDVGAGQAAAVMWTCDLTKRYIEINGDYRS
ncbi:MAG: bifunctional glutamate N-acetyltransferase/amino-acid acetyltransferase ArgJ [Pseudomonadota bacterium]